MNAHSQQLLAAIYPRLADAIQKLSTRCIPEGFYITVVQGLRTVEEQQALYEQGRTKPGKIVTNAPGGHSWHNFGLAVDCAPLIDGNVIDWNPDHPQWKTMERIGVSLGLTSGANWVRIVDAPHFQLTGPFPENAPTDTVRGLYAAGGLQAVWDVVEASLSDSLTPLTPEFTK